MADNVGYTPGTGATVAADDISGVLFQRVKVTTGADGTATDVSAANPMPVALQGASSVEVSNFPATQAVIGTIADGSDASATNMLLIGGRTAAGVAQVFETNASGHLNISDGGGSITIDAASLPLPAGAATNATLAEVRDRLPTASAAMPTDSTLAAPVRQAPQKYVDISFSQVGSGLLSPEMALIGPVGTGMAVSQSNGNLVITTGTTANAEVTIRSVASVNGSVTLKEVITLSQRIANNNFFVELVDVIGDGLAYTIVNATTVDVTRTAHGYTAANVGQRMDICAITGAAGIPMEAVIASIPNADTIRFTVAGWPATGSGTCSLTGWNKIELNYTGTVATAVNFNTRRRGWQNTAIAATINTTAAAQMGIVNVENGVASLADKVVTSAGVIANRASWDTNIPRTNETLFLQIRARNGTVAPASTTTWTVGMLRVEDYVPTQVSLVSTRVQSIQNSAPVSVIGTVPVSGTVTATVASTTVTSANLATPGIIADVASAAITATANTSALTPTFGTTYIVSIPVTAVTGTTPTMDVGVEESDDTGTNWFRVYDFPRITATGIYRSPPLTLRGNRVRYVQTITGTTPSFTRAINRLQRSDDAPLRVQFIDRTIVPNTLNSTSPIYYIEGCRDFNLSARVTAQTTAATITLRVSADGTNWLNLTPTITTAVGIVAAKYTNEQWKFASAIVTAAGTGITLGEVVITGQAS
jgi:hypothetical protein